MIIWCKNISVRVILISIWLNWKAKTATKVYYLSATKVSTFCLYFLNRNKRISFKRFNYELGEMRTKKGTALGIKMQIRQAVLSELIAKLIIERFNLSITLKYFGRKQFKMLLSRYVFSQIEPVNKLICLSEWYAKINKFDGKQYIISDAFSIEKDLLTVWKRKKIRIISFPMKELIEVGIFKLKRLLNIIKYQFYNIRYQIDQSQSDRKKIAVHYTEGSKMTKLSELLWYDFAKRICPEDIIIFFNWEMKFVKKIDPFILNYLKEMKIDWIALDHRLVNHTTKIWYPMLAVKDLLFSKRDQIRNIWLKEFINTAKFEVEYWRAFFQKNKIELVVDITNNNWKHIAQKVAIEKENGVRIGWQRSEADLGKFTPCALYCPAHIFFVWNQHSCRQINRETLRVVVGNLPNFDATSQFLIDEISDRHVDLSLKRDYIGVFDNVYGKDLYYSKKMMINFYNSIINLAKKNDEIVLIVKSKKAQFLDKLPDVKLSLLELEKKGKCIIFDDHSNEGKILITKLADIIVGIGISSAVLEMVATGKGRKTGFLFDAPSHSFHALNKIGKDRFIFDDINQMTDALQNCIDQGGQTIDLKAALEYIDPFLDNLGWQKIGEFLSIYFNSTCDDKLELIKKAALMSKCRFYAH